MVDPSGRYPAWWHLEDGDQVKLILEPFAKELTLPRSHVQILQGGISVSSGVSSESSRFIPWHRVLEIREVKD